MRHKILLSSLLFYLFSAVPTALAQNECEPVGVDPSANPGPDSYTCDQPEYLDGVTYDADGDLAVEVTTDAAEFGGNGIRLTATGADSISFDSSTAEIESRDMAGAVVDVLTEAGNIDIATEEVDGDGQNSANVTHGIRAISTGGANIGITTAATVDVAGSTVGTAGIEAITNDGGIDMTLNGGVQGNLHGIIADAGTGDIHINARGSSISSSTSNSSAVAGILANSDGGDVTIIQDFNNFENSSFGSNVTVTGRLYGIQASTTGSGNLSILGLPRDGGGGGNQISATNSAAIAGIDAAVETGQLRVDVVGNGVRGNTSTGIAIRATTQGGDAALNFFEGTTTAATVLDLDMTGGTTTITTIGNADRTPSLGSLSATLLRAAGDGEIVFDNVRGDAEGVFNLQDFDGDFTFHNAWEEDGWNTAGMNRFSEGANTIVNTGSMELGRNSGDYSLRTTTLVFGSGNDTFNNAGLMAIGVNNSGNSSVVGATVRFQSLETFNNSGLIIMGSPAVGSTRVVVGENTPDGFYDDVLVIQDAHYHGEEGARIWIDALLNNTGQTSCARNVEGLEDVELSPADRSDGFLRANDCLDFRGSAVSGRTGIVINDVIFGDRGAYNADGNVVVDVSGSDPGDVDPDAFFLAPETPGYNSIGGGVMDKGLFVYTMGYDEASQSFRLYGVESPSAIQFTLVGHAASDLWRSTTASWFDRQDALRDGEPQPDLGAGLWLRGSTSSADRDLRHSVAVGASDLEFDNSYTQDNSSVTFGADVALLEIGGGRWTVGGMVGYARARLNYNASPNTANLEGVHAGLYSNYVLGPFFANLAINNSWVELENDVPSLGLTPEGTILGTDVESLGGQLEAGWRFTLDRIDIEPLASLSMVKSSFDDINVPADDPVRFGGNVKYDDPESLRAGLGVRLAMRNILPSVAPIDARLSAKVLNESEGKSSISIENVGPIDAPVSDTFDGTFTEVSSGVSISNTRKTVSGFLDVDAAFGDDYDSLGFSAGVRVQW